jgi:CDK inhibitor PHO81
MSYKGLKKIINSLIQEKAQTSVTIAASPPPGSTPVNPEDEYSKFLQSQKAAFFFKLERELEKVWPHPMPSVQASGIKSDIQLSFFP